MAGFEFGLGDAKRPFGLAGGALVQFADVDQQRALALAFAGLLRGDLGNGHGRIIGAGFR